MGTSLGVRELQLVLLTSCLFTRGSPEKSMDVKIIVKLKVSRNRWFLIAEEKLGNRF